MSKPSIIFQDIAGMIHLNNYLWAFDLEPIGDHCFKILFAEMLLKLSKKVILAQMNWRGKCRLSFNEAEAATLNKVFDLTAEELFSNSYSLQLMIQLTYNQGINLRSPVT